MIPALCIHCETPCRLATGKEIYAHRPDLYSLYFWKCQRCPDAFVGCHRTGDGKNALGTAADPDLRKARSAAHAAFDPSWKTGKYNRSTAYAILATGIGIHPAKCHISMMNMAECARVIRFCETWM